ncbi:Gfo/Idh/MocA family oxidoreductase [Candidatus Woesearchaeota archaeon]|nr:Gfo/Idh/MocA family oxidoreductase [Candidatus Woesearchaeota archaeon]
MKKTNIAIIGVGRWGRNYLRTFNELNNANILWVCDTEESTIKEALLKVKTKSSVKTTLNYKDILEDKEVDAVAITTPGTTHYGLAKQALLSDKHVIVEKPITFNSKDAEELVSISDEMGKILMVGHLHLYNPGIRKLKEDIKAGLFGKINYIHSIGAGNGPVRQDMSALWDYFPHDVSILLYLLEKYPLILSVNGASYLKKGIEDVVTMDINFPDGIFATAVGSWLYPMKRRELIIIGEKLYAAFDDYALNKKLKYYNKATDKVEVQDIGDSKPLIRQLKHFLDCIEDNKKPLTNGYEALKVTKVLECAQKSLKANGAMVKVQQ